MFVNSVSVIAEFVYVSSGIFLLFSLIFRDEFWLETLDFGNIFEIVK